MYGQADYLFLERVFQKLLLNFTWWVNREDPDGRNVFSGGFLGLDNIGMFDRSAKLPQGWRIEQSDATSWMAVYSLDMMAIALELAQHNPSYEEYRLQILRALPVHRRTPSTNGGKEPKPACGTRLDVLLLRPGLSMRAGNASR